MSHPNRLLGLPSWSWFAISPSLIAAAVLAPWPGAAADPAEGLFREPVLVAHAPAAAGPDAPGDRIVPYGRHEGAGPVFALGVQTTHRESVSRRLGWSPGATFPDLGFFRRRDSWRYELTGQRYDAAGKSLPRESWWLPADEAAALRPLAVAELDRRSGPARRGAELARLLDEGAERESWASWQNALVLAAWLSVPMALLACVRPKAAGKEESAAEAMREV
ncbi:hypothetical protein [Paludisphaera soli]|uniref:hypothetical protein n=1 Tax=Paludisphaera soli TaxID=2712865 RepID=UPI0013ED137B|nr:hypothetical protein [Paludisphaera soli]